MRLVFSDDFSSPELNTSLWNADAECNVYASNAFIANGTLVLRTDKYNRTVNGTVEHFCRGAAVNTAKKFFQAMGRWEARVKLPNIHHSGGVSGALITVATAPAHSMPPPNHTLPNPQA